MNPDLIVWIGAARRKEKWRVEDEYRHTTNISKWCQRCKHFEIMKYDNPSNRKGNKRVCRYCVRVGTLRKVSAHGTCKRWKEAK